MAMSRILATALLAGALLGQQAQPPAPPTIETTQMQSAAGNPPRCDVCHQPFRTAPVYLVVLGTAGDLDGSTLDYPVLVCPRGHLMAVLP